MKYIKNILQMFIHTYNKAVDMYKENSYKIC